MRHIYPLLIPIVTLDWVAAQWDGYILCCVLFWGQIPVQPCRPCNSENGLLCFTCIRITGDEGAFCFDPTDRKRQEEVLKFRIDLANFDKVLSCPLYCWHLISCFENNQGGDVPLTWSQQHWTLWRSSLSSKKCTWKEKNTLQISGNSISRKSSHLECYLDKSDYLLLEYFAMVSLKWGRKVSREICTSTI